MIRRVGLRFLHRIVFAYYPVVHFNWDMMVLSKDLFSVSFSNFIHTATIDGLSQTPGKYMINGGGDFRLKLGNRLVLKGRFDGCTGDLRKMDQGQKVFSKMNDKFRKANTLFPSKHLVNKSCVGSGKMKNIEVMNGQVGDEHGLCQGYPIRPMHEKVVVAVDVDEVLGNFISALNKFIADRYSSKHSLSDYYVYEFYKIWKCSRMEAHLRVHKFFETDYFKLGIDPIPGAHDALQSLSSFCRLSVVTSRQNVIKSHTIDWIEKHFPGLFQEIHFGNHFAMEGTSRPKSEICRSLGAQFLIDDNPRYALECAEAGIKVLLFDFNNTYPWCNTGSASLHPLVTQVYNWPEVERFLVSWVAP